jgi:hypothetical protein
MDKKEGGQKGEVNKRIEKRKIKKKGKKKK